MKTGRVFYEHAKFVNASNCIGGNKALVEHGSVGAGTLSSGNPITLRIGIRSKTPPYNARVFNYNLTVVGKVGLSKKALDFVAEPTPIRAQSYFRQLLLWGQPRRSAYNLVIINNQTLLNLNVQHYSAVRTIVEAIGMTYYATRGKEHVDRTLSLVKTRSAELGVKNLIIASTRGFTAEKVLNLFKGSDHNVVVVGTARERFPVDLLGRLEEEGYSIRFSREVAYEYPDTVRDAYRRFSEGVKVAVEIVMIAADEGLIPVDADVIAMGKWDTALVIRSAKSENFSDIHICELLCKPR